VLTQKQKASKQQINKKPSDKIRKMETPAKKSKEDDNNNEDSKTVEENEEDEEAAADPNDPSGGSASKRRFFPRGKQACALLFGIYILFCEPFHLFSHNLPCTVLLTISFHIIKNILQ
jgi:hypothetical protein